MNELLFILGIALVVDFLLWFFRPLGESGLTPEEIAAIPGKVNDAHHSVITPDGVKLVKNADGSFTATYNYALSQESLNRLKASMAFHSKMLQQGMMTINEARRYQQ